MHHFERIKRTRRWLTFGTTLSAKTNADSLGLRTAHALRGERPLRPKQRFADARCLSAGEAAAWIAALRMRWRRSLAWPSRGPSARPPWLAAADELVRKDPALPLRLQPRKIAAAPRCEACAHRRWGAPEGCHGRPRLVRRTPFSRQELAPPPQVLRVRVSGGPRGVGTPGVVPEGLETQTVVPPR